MKSGNLVKCVIFALMTLFFERLCSGVALANTYPPTPTAHFYGDVNGDTIIGGSDIIQVSNYLLAKPYSFDTLQPPTSSQEWNTCDLDSDRILTGSDAIQLNNYLLTKPVTIGARPWTLQNVDLPLSGNAPYTWFPFTINLYSNHATAGLSGRPGVSVVAEIDPGSAGTGKLSGRSCSPTPGPGARDQLAGGGAGAQCALAVAVTDWTAAPDHGDTEPGTYGLAIWGNGDGDLTLKLRIEADPALDIPAVSTTLTVSFSAAPPSYFPIANTLISNEFAIDAAYDGANFLVGIEGGVGGGFYIGAQLVSPAGALTGFLVTTGRTGGGSRLAFDGANYLMVWQDDLNYPLSELYGQFIDMAGALSGAPFKIADLPIPDDIGGIAYGGGNYLVDYNIEVNSVTKDSEVRGRIVTPAGGVGPEFAISSGFGDFGMKNVAYDGANFLVVWTDDVNDSEVRGRFVSPAGALGTEFSINASLALSDNPLGVEFDGVNYLVVWMDQNGAGWDIYGQLVDTSGGLVGGVINISIAASSKFAPAIVFDGTDYLISWTDMRNDADADGLCGVGEKTCDDVYGQYVSAAGALVGTEFVIDNGPYNQLGLLGAYGGGRYLELVNTEVDMSLGAFDDLYGMVWSPGGNPPLQQPFPIAAMFASEYIPATRSIILDGNIFDWSGVSPLATDPQFDDDPGYTGDDIKAIYIAKDATNLYIRADLWDSANTNFQNGSSPKEGSYRFYVDNNGPYLHLGVGIAYDPLNAYWSMGYGGSNSNAPPSLQGPGFVGVAGGIIEIGIPLADIGNPTEFYGFDARVPDAMLAPSTVTILDDLWVGGLASESSVSGASDGSNYLVGFERDWLDGIEYRSAIEAQMVSSTGSPVGPRIQVGRNGNTPRVAFDGANYLMVWDEWDNWPSNDIYGMFVDTSANPVGPPFAISPALGQLCDMGGLAYGGGNYLAVYFVDTNPPTRDCKAYGRTIDTAGVVGPEFPISVGLGVEGVNNVAFNGTNFLVVWVDDTSQQNIVGRYVSPAGVPGTEFTINSSPEFSEMPAMAASDGVNFLVTWSDDMAGTSWDVFAQLVDGAGNLIGGPITVSNAAGLQFGPFPAFDGTDYLVVWTDARKDTNFDGFCDPGEGTCWDMYGQYITTAGTLKGAEFIVNDLPGNQYGGPVYGGGKYLIGVNDTVSLFNEVDKDVWGMFLTP